ncbi:TRM11 family methyltransferase [Paenibacillus sp. XY044]|uniref:TRM11 family SAM-dependent methyltransferase n=1 Tax=Paenibacillus sp. XY044 TaxID=2026089 RepID=UPI000B98FA9E|nr:RsmD family RNA methyltransferase [Paenibacillus sp. XY044]OZB95955.1 RNA methyltransferase [Paenibacillus sp. XY044]
MEVRSEPLEFIYTYASHESETELCRMELDALLGQAKPLKGRGPMLLSSRELDPGRSPYVSMRLDVLMKGASAEDIALQASELELGDGTFKVTYVKSGDPCSYEDQRLLERLVGSRIRGKAEMKHPDVQLGLLSAEGQWMLGLCRHPERAWRLHKDKPHNYSTGLSVTTARSLVNILVPEPPGIRAVDPCCGMGNVLIEALSMGIDIRGWDINPLAIQGARANLKHFGYPELVTLGDMTQVAERFDVAVLDMPYNLCSVLSTDQRLGMLQSLRRMAKRAVIVSTEEADESILQAGFTILDSARVWKGSFVRNVWLCG